jgi:predicted RNase H-like HicB family nuclease
VPPKHDKFTYRVTWSEADEEYVGLCAEFPSLSWLAASPEAALKGIRNVVAEVISDMMHNGESVPQPIATKRYSGKFMVRIPPTCIANSPFKQLRPESALTAWRVPS